MTKTKANANKAAPIANAGSGNASGVNNGGAATTTVAPVVVDGKGGADAGLATVIYFDFDSFVVKDEFKPVVEGNGKALIASGKKAAVEGHADERGSKESTTWPWVKKRAEAVVKSPDPDRREG